MAAPKELHQQGMLVFANYLRKVADCFTRDIEAILKECQVSINARQLPCLLLVKGNGQISVSELADKLGQTHSAVSQMSRKLSESELVFDAVDPADDRKRLLCLTPKGYECLDRLEDCFRLIETELADMSNGKGAHLMAQILQLEESQYVRSLHNRVLLKMQQNKTSSPISIVEFDSLYRDDFKRLNIAWLEKYFYVESIDGLILSNPEKHIIAAGGQIFLALRGSNVVGTAALIANDNNWFELSKMSVAEEEQGQGIGRKLALKAIQYFKQSTKEGLFLESNSKLKAALTLYQSLGFVHAEKSDNSEHYQRADIYMVYQPSVEAPIAEPAAESL